MQSRRVRLLYKPYGLRSLTRAVLCRLQQLLHGGPRASPLLLAQHLYCVAQGGLDVLRNMCEYALIKALHNLALVLNRMNHHELALGYAHTATRLDATAVKARYQAAVACMALGHHSAALHYVVAVRTSACGPCAAGRGTCALHLNQSISLTSLHS